MTDQPAPPPPPIVSQTVADILASITPDQKQQLYLLALAATARGDGVEAVADFGEVVFGFVPAPIHRTWLENAETPPPSGLSGPRVAATAPPESAKTTWMTIIRNAWKIGKHPELSFAIGSAGEKAADDMAKAVANTIEFNPRWKLVFPHVVPDKQRGWSSDGYHVRRQRCENLHCECQSDERMAPGEWERIRYGDKNPTLVSGGVGSARWNGLRLTGGLTLDDMHDRRSKTEQKTCDDTVGFFKDTAEFRVTGQGFLVIMQTRWNAKDVIAEVKQRKDFSVFEHPAIQNVGGVEVSYWPAQHSLEKLQSIRERGPIDFELVFQGNDKAVEGHLLKTIWLHAWPAAQIKHEWNRYFGVDFAQRLREIEKAGDDPDRFSLTVWADTGARAVIEDVFAEELYFGDAEELFFAKAGIYNPLNSGVEVNGASAKKFYLALLTRMRLLGKSYVITPVTRTRSKGEYLNIIAPFFKSGQLLVSDAVSPGLELFRAEWAMFPNGHDDTLDSAYNGYSILGHLLPQDNSAATAERARRQAAAVSPGRLIEQAYR